MCFVLYIGTNKEIPEIPYSEKDPHIWTEKLSKEEESVRRNFSLPVVNYVGSDERCGCGFRHINFEDGEWVYSYDEENNNKQNHQELFDFIKKHLSDHDKVEIYTRWEGSDKKIFQPKEEIDLTEIIKDEFRFKFPTLYTVRVNK